jgi:hypothetical protein
VCELLVTIRLADAIFNESIWHAAYETVHVTLPHKKHGGPNHTLYVSNVWLKVATESDKQ